MIRNLSKLFLALCLLTVGGGIVANAQIDTDSRIQVNVPFTFVVHQTTLPEGKYEIRTLDDNTQNVLELSSIDGRTKVLFETDSTRTRDDEPAKKTELVFDKVGDKYFLSQVWVEGTISGSQLVKSKMEKRLEASGGKPERQSIAANLSRAKR